MGKHQEPDFFFGPSVYVFDFNLHVYCPVVTSWLSHVYQSYSRQEERVKAYAC